MIINNAQVQLNAQHESVRIHKESLNIQIWKPPVPDTQENMGSVDISFQGITSEAATETQQLESVRKNIEFEVSLLKQIIERLTGKSIQFYQPNQVQQSKSSTHNSLPTSSRDNESPQMGFGLSIDHSTSTIESEKLSFEAIATVITSDGRSIDISLNLKYSSRIETTSQLSLRFGQALKDPLILNFSGSAAELSSQKFEFDLDIDGSVDQVPKLNSDSAFLALDKNGDGIINDGSEFFGAASGNGFAELTQYDQDNNQWIDEKDDVFSQLWLYRPDSTGQQQLISLNQKGVGALFLGNLETPFQLVDNKDQQLQGEIRSSGLFLYEDGQAGSIHQLDLAI